MMESETELYMDNEHLTAKMYKLYLKFEREEELVKDSMVKWAKNGYNTQLEQWENTSGQIHIKLKFERE